MSCRAESLIAAGATDDAVAEATAELLVAVVATLSDPCSDIGAPVWEDGFAAEVHACAAELGLQLPEAAQGVGEAAGGARPAAGTTAESPADVLRRETEYVRLFVNGRRGPACPSWASYYLENRLAGTAALRAAPMDAASLGGAVPLEAADDARSELAALAVLLLERRLDEARACLIDHLEPWGLRFADRLAGEARLPEHRLAAGVLQALFAPAAAEVAMSA
jgi:TorA maturation chaperone TorD